SKRDWSSDVCSSDLTAILASDYAHRLKQIPPEALRRARRFSRQISVVKEALSIAKIPGVRVIHDPTEGGILNASWELGEASRLRSEERRVGKECRSR